jgi:hypothetical protein
MEETVMRSEKRNVSDPFGADPFGAAGAIIDAGGEGLVGWTLDAVHGDDQRQRVAHKSRRWRDGGRCLRVRENSVEWRTAP